MQVKSYKARTISQALELVKKELGPDAIILGQKQVTVSPTETHVEVMAAVDQRPSDPGSNLQPGAREVELQDDIREIKSFLSLLISSKDYFTQLQMQQPVAEIYHSLLSHGMDEKQAYILLSKAISVMNEAHPDKKQIMDAFLRQVLDKIKLSRPFQNMSGSNGANHTFAFIGPTGVGKTTTLAKLAAYLKIKRKLEVGIISVDTYRIGAVEQLQTYTNILNIPLQVAQSKAELVHARDKFQHHDVVLIDTTGKNFLNREYVKDLQEILDERTGIQHFLVLSATAKDEDLKQTILHFRTMNIHSLIFTKIDETMNHGNMINQLLRFPYAASYLGTGQRVPEDLETATQKRLLAFLLPARK